MAEGPPRPSKALRRRRGRVTPLGGSSYRLSPPWPKHAGLQEGGTGPQSLLQAEPPQHAAALWWEQGRVTPLARSGAAGRGSLGGDPSIARVSPEPRGHTDRAPQRPSITACLQARLGFQVMCPNFRCGGQGDTA